MTTTSLKLTANLKQRAAAAAQRLGVSPHAFMVNAIDHATMAAEQRASFLADAQSARKNMVDSGKGYDADEVHAYLKARIAGKNAAKPKAVAWRG